jgi:hypothetical protein
MMPEKLAEWYLGPNGENAELAVSMIAIGSG